MGWEIAAGCLAVLGTALLTLGTGAQAKASLAEYRTMRQQVSKASQKALDEAIDRLGPGGGGQFGFLLVILFFLLLRLEKLALIRAKGPDEDVQLARFLRLARVWRALMIGSAFALVAAVIQLVLACQ
jgi:hypothetical protein